jgi:hypothetical protein
MLFQKLEKESSVYQPAPELFVVKAGYEDQIILGIILFFFRG